MSSRVGTTLCNRYEIREELPRGAMGHVYAAWDREQARSVALKMIDQDAGEKQRERFRREALALAQLRHPHIVEFYHYAPEHDPPFLVMQYIEGRNLDQWWTARGRTSLTLREALRFIAPVGRALHYAHTKQIYHRDVKPDNILLDAAGQPFLTDFGIASLDDGTRWTQGFLGTLAYAAPEQFGWRSIEDTDATSESGTPLDAGYDPRVLTESDDRKGPAQPLLARPALRLCLERAARGPGAAGMGQRRSGTRDRRSPAAL